MESCLLCLEINKEPTESIGVYSNQWPELNLKSLIEKHFWIMDTIDTETWLCSTCWQELNDFHKFYERVKNAHLELGLISNTDFQDSKDVLHHNRLSSKEDIKDLLHADDILNESQIEPEISLYDTLSTESIIEEQKPLIKKEQNYEEHLDNDEDDMPLRQRRKRECRNTYVKESCKKSKQTTVIKSKIKKSKNCAKILAKEPVDNLAENEKSDFKQDPNFPHKPEEHNISLDLQDDQNNHDNDTHDTDSDYEPDKEQSLETSETNKRPNPYYTPKTHEKDKFLAENFKMTCALCQNPVETFNNLRKHFQLKHKQRGFATCCNRKFFRRSVLVDHVHRHLNPNYFKCQQCGKVMSDRRCLNLHIKTHDGSKQEKNHSCDICGKSFGSRMVLKTHKLIHLSEEEKRFPCSECGKNFGNGHLLSNHVRAVHLNKYAKICDICGKSIRCKEVFERHMLEHEGKPARNISCDICGLLLAGKRGLKRHKDMIHPVGGKQEYTCSMCAKVSPNLKAHKRHFQYKHELGYDHKCTICEKAFKRAQALTEHMATHTGTVLYTCPWCPKTFNSNANMHNHRKKGHPKEWEEATRKKYSGNLPPNYKPPIMNFVNDEYAIALNVQ